MMKNLHIRDNLKNFLYDLENFISIYDNNFHVFNYQKLSKLSNTEIIFTMHNMIVKLNGINLKIKKMTKQELLIMGHFTKVLFEYEE